MTIQTQIQLNMEPQWHPFLFLIFFATLFEYNLHRLVTIIFFPETLKSGRHRWVYFHKKLFYTIVIFSVVGFLAALIEAKLSVLIALSPFALITLFYSTPLSKSGKGIFRIREIPFLKIFLIALVWSVLTITLPVIYSESTMSKINILTMMAERFLFVFAITIPFDIRDMNVDKKGSLKTIPLKIGERKSVIYAVRLIIIFIIISLVHYLLINQFFIAVALMISGIITIFCITSKKIRNLQYYHYGILDGMMILQTILTIISYAILK